MKQRSEKLSILHLEDSSSDAELIARELNKANIDCQIRVVADKPDFENALLKYTPDVILSDHSLPAFDSVAALKLANQYQPGVPFILVTATTSEEFAVNILQKGAADYILKDNLKRLPSSVLNAISKKQLTMEKETAQLQLKQSFEQVRKLASHLQLIREEERASIAREIHDELGQQLTGIKLDVLWLMLKTTDVSEEVRSKIKKMELMLNGCLTTVKRVSKDLHPALLHKLGIVEAIRWQTKEFRERTGIQVDLQLPDKPIQLKQDLALAVYRIYQESLTNIARHAAAQHVYCSLKTTARRLVFKVTDDGQGFDQALTMQNNSLGLLGMNERTTMIGGKCNIQSAPGKGTTIHVELPVQ